MSAFFLSLILSTPPAAGQTIVAVRPATTITHDVEISSDHGRDYRSIELVGPRYYGTFLTDDPSAPDDPTPITYAWYKITSPAPKSPTFAGRCTIQTDTYALGMARFLLIPAITLSGDKVESKQNSGNMMVAVDLIPNDNSPDRPNVPQMVCLPISQRHHSEISAVRPQERVFVVRKSPDLPEDGTIGLIDQFGLHQCKQLRSVYVVTPVPRNRLFPAATAR